MLAFVAPGPMEVLVVGFMIILTVLPLWLICQKAGFPGWCGLAVLLPILNIALLFFLAFADWPALRDTAQQNGNASQ